MKPCSQNKPFCRQRNINANQPIIIPLRGPKTCNLVRKCLLLQSKCNKISYHWLAVDAVLRNLLQQQFPYTWPDYSIPYLGIYFTRSTKSLFLHNYLPLRAKIQADLHNMAKHDFSWWGRLAAFKMIQLLQILYLFRTLPIPIPASFFKSLQDLLSRFFWNGKKSRCSHSKLIKHRMYVGVGYIDFQDYFLANNLGIYRVHIQHLWPTKTMVIQCLAGNTDSILPTTTNNESVH